MTDRLQKTTVEKLDCGKCGSTDLKPDGTLRGLKAYRCRNCGIRFNRVMRYDGLKGTSLARNIKVE